MKPQNRGQNGDFIRFIQKIPQNPDLGRLVSFGGQKGVF